MWCAVLCCAVLCWVPVVDPRWLPQSALAFYLHQYTTSHHTTPHHNIHTTPYHTTPHLSHHTRTAIICRSPQTKFPELSWGADSGKPRFPSDGHTTPNHTKPHQTTPYHTTPHHTTPCISNMAPLARARQGDSLIQGRSGLTKM